MAAYKSSDEMPLEIWKALVELGFVGSITRIKTNHPDQEGPKRSRRNKKTPIVGDIVRSHRSVVAESDNVHQHIVSVPYLASKYKCSEALIYKATIEARLKLGLSNNYRFSGLKGCFLHETETERYRRKMLSKGRKGRGIISNHHKSDTVKNTKVNEKHKVKFKD